MKAFFLFLIILAWILGIAFDFIDNHNFIVPLIIMVVLVLIVVVYENS